MNERGAPTPVAWTRLRAPESLMGPADPAAMEARSRPPAHAKYAAEVDRESAREKLAATARGGGREGRRGGRAKEGARSNRSPGDPRVGARDARNDGAWSTTS